MKGKREGAHAEDTSFAKYGNALSDYGGVVAVVGKYVAGLKSGNIDELERASTMRQPCTVSTRARC